MPATLPTTWVPNHAPTAVELAQVLNAVTRITNVATLNTTAATITTTSGSYADVSNTSLSWTKYGDGSGSPGSGSNVLVAVFSGWRATTTAPTSVGIAVNINGTDTRVAQQECTVSGNLTQHLFCAGVISLTGVPAGAYTVKLRAARTGGTGTVIIDGTDVVSYLVAELPL